MLIIDEARFRSVMDIQDTLSDIRDSLCTISSGEPGAIVREFIDEPENSKSALILGGYVSDMGSICLKMVGQFNGRQTQTVVLLNSDTGEPEGVVVGGYVCDFRTGGVTAAATQVLARENTAHLAVVGTGAQSVTQVQGVLAVRPIESISVWNRTRSRGEEWVAMMQKTLGRDAPKISFVESVEEAVSEADIIVTSTSSRTPVLKGEWIKAGAHINAVGAGAAFQRELDVSVLTRADLISVDVLESALQVGDFIEPLALGAIAKADVVEIGEIMLGRRQGRANDEQVTLFKSVGHIANDIAVVRAALKKAGDMKGLLQP